MNIAMKLLIVEDDMIIAADIALQLSKLGYEVSGIVPRGEEAIRHAETDRPDLIQPPSHDNTAAPFVLNDRIFVRHREMIVKIFIADILYVEADRNYCHLFTANKEYLMTTTLKVMEDKLPVNHFVRVHRSFLVNLTQLDEVGDGHVVVNGKSIPLSHNLRDSLLKRIRTI